MMTHGKIVILAGGAVLLSLLALTAWWGGWLGASRRPAVSPIPEMAEMDAFNVEDDTVAPGQDSDPPVAVELAERLGIEITALQVAAGGLRLNLRYRVLDELLASQLITNTFYQAYILDDKGQRFSRPYTPPSLSLRAESGQPLRSGRTYTYFFPNPGQTVQAGDRVTLVIGDVQARNLVVR